MLLSNYVVLSVNVDLDLQVGFFVFSQARDSAEDPFRCIQTLDRSGKQGQHYPLKFDPVEPNSPGALLGQVHLQVNVNSLAHKLLYLDQGLDDVPDQVAVKVGQEIAGF